MGDGYVIDDWNEDWGEYWRLRPFVAKPDRDIGVKKPHFSYSRYDDGKQMVECREWPNWPHAEGSSFSCGETISEAWEAHIEPFDEEPD